MRNKSRETKHVRVGAGLKETTNSGPARWPLTTAQKLIWAGQKLHPDAPLYNMAFAFEIDGEIDPEAFRRAFAETITNVATLRTTIGEEAGEPFQLVHKNAPFDLKIADFSVASDPPAAFVRWATNACREILPIERITFDAALARLGEGRWGFYLNQHHIVSDAVSAALIFRQISDAYLAASQKVESARAKVTAFSEYIETEASLSEASRNTEHWRKYRQGQSEALSLYGKRGHSRSTGNFRLDKPLGLERMNRLKVLSQSGVYRALTPEMAIFRIIATAVFAFVGRISAAQRITIGALSHNRADKRFAKTAGLFVEMLPLGIELDENDTFHDLYLKVRTETDQFLRAVGPGAGDPALLRHANVVLNMIRSEMGDLNGVPVRTTWLHSGHVDDGHHLRIHAHDYDGAGEFTLSFDFNDTVFTLDAAEAAIGDFLVLLDAIIENDSVNIGVTPLVDPQSTRASVRRGDVPVSDFFSIVERFQSNARRAPDMIAVEDGGETLTYGALWQQASALASKLERGQRVAICLPRSSEAIIAILAAQIAGAVFVPVDPTWPTERIRFVINDSGCSAAVCEDGRTLPECVIQVQDIAASNAELATSVQQSPDELAYILYTSGSTGNPKGVGIENRALGNYIGWASGFYDQGRGLSFPLFTKLTFDLTITSVFTPLVSGGRVVVYREADGSADLAVADVFADDRVDIVKLTPAHLALVADRDFRRTRISQLILGGEELLTPLARRVHQGSNGRIAIHNEYGPTEATVGCIVHTYDPTKDTEAAIPIGRPINGMSALVLDANRYPVPLGVSGDLWLAGDGLAREYVNRAELTADKFAKLPGLGGLRAYRSGDKARLRDDGVFEYLGRDDAQIKLRGHRIELGEIEAAIAEDPAISAVAVKLVHRDMQMAHRDDVHCTRCGLSSTYPDVTFDDAGVCNHCAAFDRYADRAQIYFRSMPELEAVFADSRKRTDINYDCIALLSGGKDSTYMLARLVDMGLRVLAWTLDNGFISSEAKANIKRVTDHLGVDHVFGQTPAMNEIFVDSLNRHANVCNGCFKTIYTLATDLAVKRGIPFIVTGLSRGQFFETRLTEDLFTKMTVSVEKIDANVLAARKSYHRVEDAVSRLLDTDVVRREDTFERTKYIDFYRYCDVELDELMAYLDRRVPWLRPTDTGRSTNCLINDVGIYVHKRRRGYHNYALPYSWDVRMGHKTRKAALDELDDDIDEESVRRILGEIGFTDSVDELTPQPVLAAFFTATDEIDIDAIRDRLRSKLPEIMIPARLVRVEEMPLTRNGKIDREALVLKGATREDLGARFVAPVGEIEEKLCTVWSGVLNVDCVGAEDDFYELGGDSISAIQIVARAQRAGISFSLATLLDARTVRRLSASVGTAAKSRKRHLGHTPMTPAQHWLFARNEAPHHFMNVIELAAPASMTEESLRSCLATLVQHHDALRMSFKQNDGAWQAWTHERADLPELRVLDAHASDSDVSAHFAWLRAPFELAKAPLLRALFISSGGAEGRLYFSGHHLIVDAVSWSLLSDDLAYLHDDAGTSIARTLPDCTADFVSWVEMLKRQASISREQKFWEAIVRSPAQALLQTVARSNTAALPASASFALSADMTEILQSGVHAWRIGIDEIIAAAIVQTFSNPASASPVRLFIERHGRESTDDNVDATRLMGWLTSLFPVLIEVAGLDDPIDIATATKDAFRAAPRGGVGYGALQYLLSSTDSGSNTQLNQEQHVLFNHFGRVDSAGGAFRLLRPIELVRGSAKGGFGLEVHSHISNFGLSVEFAAPTGLFTQTDLELKLNAFADNLIRMIRAFEEAEEAPISAGDFPLAGLDRRALDDLASFLDGGAEK